MKQYLSEREVSKVTGLAIQTLRNWRHRRRGFTYIKIGRCVRYDPEDVEAFMQNKKIKLE